MQLPSFRSIPALAITFMVLLLNSAYLAARADPTTFYFANVAGHALGGVVLVVWSGWLLRRSGFPRGVLLRVFIAIAGVAALLGLALLFTGATRRFQSLVNAHVVAGVLTAIVFGLVALSPRSPVVGRIGRRCTAAALTFVALAAVAAAMVAWGAPAARASAYRIENPLQPPLSMEEEGGGPGSPFFPSSSRTNVGGIIPARFFLTSETCGRCHKDIYDQWKSSMHHFSSFNNQWYRKSIEYMQDVAGVEASKWCAGCHDHAVFFNGRFDTPIKDQIDTPEAQAGLGCMSCHAITGVGSTMGQGDFTIEYPPLHDLAASENKVLATVHDALIYLDPQPHREAFLKPFHTDQTAEFCSSCHKVHLDVPVNAYRWFRGFNDYDNWQASGVSGQGARSFYYPPKAQKCADCHMAQVKSNDPAARDGLVKSHRFAAANTAVPFVNNDHEQLRLTQEFLQDKQVSVDIFALVRGDEGRTAAGPSTVREPQIASTFAVGEESMNFGAGRTVSGPTGEVYAPLEAAPSVRAGESVRVDVVVRTRKVGHFFPGGTVDAFDVWVELEAIDSTGRVIMHSGAVRDGGPVDPSAHFYRSLMLDGEGNPINKRNAFMARSVAYVRLIPPGAADTVRYRLQVPPDATGEIRLRAKVNYRKFSWWNTQWSYAGVRDPAHKAFPLSPSYDGGRWLFTGDTSTVSGEMKSIPNLPITVMAEDVASLRVIRASDTLPAAPAPDGSARERWNDYGIGLLLQGDLRAAREAFLTVTRIEPSYADGWVNVARVHVLEGDVMAAETFLRKALEIDGNLAKTHFFLGVSLKEQGRYAEALTHLQRAEAQYPRDRVVVNQIGRILFLQRRFEEAVSALQRVLSIDPEDLQAHYTLMLAYQGLGDTASVAREKTLYERFKADEASQSLTGPYRQLNPDDNNERQSVHEHRPPASTAKGAR